MWITITRTAQWHDAPIRPEQALNREEMIRYYTINNAWLMKLEDEVGSLNQANERIIIVDRDLLECTDDEVKDTKVLSTWLAESSTIDQSDPTDLTNPTDHEKRNPTIPPYNACCLRRRTPTHHPGHGG